VFWHVHDPTQLNRQGNDIGTQYRSVIFYHSDEQKRLAEEAKRRAQHDYTRPVVTEITDASTFYKAGADHQDYYRRNSRQQYCQVVIAPKLNKLREQYHDKLKP
jgi:peptide-methionine (S)-S-oxide reductase